MPLRTKQQMVDEEAACHALTVIQVHRQRKEARVTPFISSAQALNVCISSAVCSEVIIFFYS